MFYLQTFRHGWKQRGLLILGILSIATMLNSPLCATTALATLGATNNRSWIQPQVNSVVGSSDRYTPTWCVDSAATSSITNVVTDFTSRYRSLDITMKLAKKGATMKAIGIGDCLIHCLYNYGNSVEFLIPDVYHVPDAGRRLMSTRATSARGCQFILPSSAEKFPPGLYMPDIGTRSRSKYPSRYIPFDTMGGLLYISTRNDLGTEPPHTKENDIIFASRKLGHCPLQTLWDTRKVVTGLESLKDSH